MLKIFKPALFVSALLVTTAVISTPATAAFEERPSLIISQETMPEVIYNRGSADVQLMPTPIVTAPAPYRPVAPTRGYVEANVTLDKPFNLITSHRPTPVTAKVDQIAADLARLQGDVSAKEARMSALNSSSEAIARDYYALVAGMNAKLQGGTTPGNPDLVESWDAAQNALNALGETSSDLAALGNDITNDASRAAMLADTIQSTFSLSGARDEDHENLTTLEDRTNETLARVDRLLNNLNDEMNRRTAYLRSERLNMQTLALAVENGDLYGGNIKNRMFKTAEMASAAPMMAPTYASAPAMPSGLAPMPTMAPQPVNLNTMAAPGRRPLVIIRFDKPNLQYENALYGAVSQALDKRPNAVFDLVAVSPASGNSAQLALNANAARKNGDDVLRALTQMGVPMDRINLASSTSSSARHNEVHLYIR